ncbi:MAG TPA: hypothetical protein PLS29_00125 [Acidimicrobiales bacterium]|nr:MAG: hypothetical protein B7Z69_09885 [Actinobacteria bacterium 21-73-9]HQU25413.1 hypothetical protein [Acidimicrobiales bacterium]
MDDAYRDSLSRRLRAVHHLYRGACATMSLEQVNAVTAPTTLPIAFSLVHQLLIEDVSRALCGGPAPLCAPDALEPLGLEVPDHGKERPVEEMMAQRIGDYGAFCALQGRVFATTEAYVAAVGPATFDEVLVAAPYPERLARTFSALVGAERGITRSDALECWVYQHAVRHLGEIEHARSLVGLGGMTS